MRVGFVGVGSMGTPMARLVIPHHSVTVFDPDDQRVRALEADGATPTHTAAAAARNADAVIVMVANATQMEEALFGSYGVVNGLTHGASVVLMSTVGIEAVKSADARLRAEGARVVDAPVTGGVARAITGELTALIGACGDDLNRVAPLLRLMAVKLAHCGTLVGDGQAVKLVNQLLCSVHLAAAAEALTFAQGIGLDPAKVLGMIETGAAASFMLSDRGPRMIATDPPHVLSAIDIFVKDSSLVLDAAHRVGAATPLIQTAHALFVEAAERGFGRADDSAVIHALEEKHQ